MSKIIVLRAVYDDSDIQTDYYHPDRTLEEWHICGLEGEMVTETKIRKALKLLPEWLRAYDWQFRKGEKYSMSDHYYGQLRMDEGVGLAVKNSWGYKAGLRFILTAMSLRIFEMNRSVETPIPKSLEEIRELIQRREEEMERRLEEAKKRMEEVMPKIIASSHAVIDGGGFRVLTDEDKQDLLKCKTCMNREDCRGGKVLLKQTYPFCHRGDQELAKESP